MNRLQGEVQKMAEENNKFAANNEKLQGEVNRLSSEVDKMAAENEKFAANNAKLELTVNQITEQNSKFEQSNKDLEEMIKRLKAEIEKLGEENKKFAENNAKLKEEVSGHSFVLIDRLFLFLSIARLYSQLCQLFQFQEVRCEFGISIDFFTNCCPSKT